MMNSNKVLLAILAVAVCACAPSDVSRLRDGDLVFCLGATGAMGQAIASATDRGEGPVVHVGIYAVVAGRPSVIEAVPDSGVTVTSWDEFIAANRVPGVTPCIKVMRAAGADAPAAVNRALGYVGRPYDFACLPGDDALYCSELVYECYTDSCGNRIFEAAPMNFLAPDGTLPDYWRQLYDSLGTDVPQGLPGTNPAAMSASPILAPVLIVE